MTRAEYDDLKVRQEESETQYKTACALLDVEKDKRNYEKASELLFYSARRSEEALDRLIELAMCGHVCAQYWLGQYYLKFGKDHEYYARWSFVAMERGPSQIIKGKLYELRYSGKACESLFDSANKKMAEACFYCGLACENGIGVPQDYAEASSYYLKAGGGYAEARKRYNKIEDLLGHRQFNMIVGLAPKRVNEIRDSVKKQENFSEMLIRLINEKKVDEVELYKKLNISRQTWSNIINGKNTPKKNAVLALAVALKLDLATTEKLMSKLGYLFLKSDDDESFRDSLVMECIENKEYDVFDINEMLDEQGVKSSLLLGYHKKE